MLEKVLDDFNFLSIIHKSDYKLLNNNVYIIPTRG